MIDAAMTDEFADVCDWDAVPDELKLTPARLRELTGDDPGLLDRYLHSLELPEEGRCLRAVRGAGGLYWPCARPRHPGERYCFGHLDPERDAPRQPGTRGRVASVLRRLRRPSR